MILDLQAWPYEVTAKGDIKRMRKEGKLPAIIYGHKEKSKRVYIEISEFKKVLDVLRKEAITVNLKVNDKGHLCVIKSIQRNPVSGDLFHIDFQHIHKKEKIRASIPIHLKGEAPGVKTGGILDQHLHEVTIKCLPVDMPSHIDVDISGLEMGHAIHLSDITLPNVEFELAKETTVVSILVPRAVAAEVKTEAAEEISEEGAKEGEVKPEEDVQRKQKEEKRDEKAPK